MLSCCSHLVSKIEVLVMKGQWYGGKSKIVVKPALWSPKKLFRAE